MIDDETGQFEIVWQNNDLNRGATLVEVVSRHAVATGPLNEL
jgi:hypothetical protein